MQRRRLTMGQVVDECIREATEEWFRQNLGYRSREEALANDVQLISATVERRPGGRLRVHTGIVTRDRKTTTSDMWEYQRSGELGFVETDKSKRVG